jgi:predicted TIM-barrel fold metal-dependent hydrolase
MQAVDCHAHIFPPQFPLPEGAGHKPQPYERKTREEYMQTLREHGVTHGVLVQPSGYQRDNSAMLDAMAFAGGAVKGIAMIDYGTSDEQMAELERRGVVGHRFNLVDLDRDELRHPDAVRLLERLRDRGWYAEIHARSPWLTELAPTLERHGGTLIFCHMGRPSVELGVDEPGFRRFLEFGRSGQAIAKLTGAIRLSREPFPFADVDPFVAAVLDAFTAERCIWGSDWPFILLQQRIDYAQTLAWLERVVPNADDRRRILWDNPARLFGFST